MKSPWTKIINLFGVIFDIGIRAMIISALIEILLLLIAVGVGVIVWVSKDLFTGFASGLITFIFGQGLVVFILDMMFQLPDRSHDDTTLPTDTEVLQALRDELKHFE